MKAKRIDHGTVGTTRMGTTTIGLRVPDEWCAHHELSEGDTLYCTGLLDGGIEYHLDARPWSKQVALRIKGGRYPVLTILSNIARPRGIDNDSRLRISVDPESGSLYVIREDRA